MLAEMEEEKAKLLEEELEKQRQDREETMAEIKA